MGRCPRDGPQAAARERIPRPCGFVERVRVRRDPVTGPIRPVQALRGVRTRVEGAAMRSGGSVGNPRARAKSTLPENIVRLLLFFFFFFDRADPGGHVLIDGNDHRGPRRRERSWRALARPAHRASSSRDLQPSSRAQRERLENRHARRGSTSAHIRGARAPRTARCQALEGSCGAIGAARELLDRRRLSPAPAQRVRRSRGR